MQQSQLCSHISRGKFTSSRDLAHFSYCAVWNSKGDILLSGNKTTELCPNFCPLDACGLEVNWLPKQVQLRFVPCKSNIIIKKKDFLLLLMSIFIYKIQSNTYIRNTLQDCIIKLAMSWEIQLC